MPAEAPFLSIVPETHRAVVDDRAPAARAEGNSPAAASTPPDVALPPARSPLLFRSVFTPVWSSGLILSVCLVSPMFLMPGCNNTKTPFYPYEWYNDVHSVSNFFAAQGLLWPYAFGLLVCFGTLLVVISRNPRHFRTLWTAYAVAITITVVGFWCAVTQEFQKHAAQGGSTDWSEQLIAFGPTCVLLAVLLLTYFNCRTWFAAALWVQFTLSLLALAWFAFVEVAVGADLLIGGWASLLASAVLVAATGCVRIRGLASLGVALPARPRRRPAHAPPTSSHAPLPRSSPSARLVHTA